MRHTAFTWFAVAGVFATAAISACSTEVITSVGGATASASSSSSSGAAVGAGGSAGVTASATSSGNSSVAVSSSGAGGNSGAGGHGGFSGTSSASGTGGEGGGSSCAQVCAKIDACNSFVNCTLIEQYAKITFDCSSAQQICLGNCLEPQINCASLFSLGGAVQTCTKMCGITGTGGTGGGAASSSSSASSSTGSSSTSASSSGNPQAGCNGCVQSGCKSELASCAFDFKTGCGQWVQCLGGCNDAACTDACNMNNPAAYAAHQDVLTCACSSCEAECPLTDPCSYDIPDGGVVSDGGAASGDAGVVILDGGH